MKVPILVMVVGVATTATLAGAAREFATPRHAQANAGPNVIVAGAMGAYDDVFGPETEAGVIGGDSSSIFGSAPLGSGTSTPIPRRSDTADAAEAGKSTTPDLANVRDCAGGICTVYRIGPVASDSSEQLH